MNKKAFNPQYPSLTLLKMSKKSSQLKICIVCGKDWSSGVSTCNGITYEKWYSGPTCNGCYNREYGKKRITFDGKRLYLKEIPRTGICKLCGKKAKDGDTHIHHEKYGKNPLSFTIELCPKCHTTRGRKIKWWGSHYH